MPLLLNDEEIEKLVREEKLLPDDFQARMKLKSKKGHSETELDIEGADRNQFRIILRQSLFNPLDFSVIFAYLPKESNQIFKLRRYNGKSHEHTNTIEREDPFYDFHIHMVTERYQRLGVKEEFYAEATSRYNTFEEAISCMITDCSLILPPNTQTDFISTGKG